MQAAISFVEMQINAFSQGGFCPCDAKRRHNCFSSPFFQIYPFSEMCLLVTDSERKKKKSFTLCYFYGERRFQ